ncbi:putative Na+/solute symporter [[Clostridium] ultunense Esp]|nr:putative Na+/solute symporter [[Clostridium] ultunense Esp]
MRIIELAFIIIYLIICLLIGIFVSKRATSSEEEYWVGGRFLGKVSGAFAVYAVVGSASTIMGSAGLAYSTGIPVAAAVAAGFALQFPLIAYIMAKPLLDRNICTLGDYFLETIGGRRVQWLYSILTLVFMAAYIIPQLKASGIIGHWLLGERFNYSKVVFIMGIVYLIYSSIGGMWAVTITDIMQGAVMFIGVMLLGVTILVKNNLGELIEVATTSIPSITKMNMAPLSVIGLAMIWGLWGLVAPMTVMRVLTMQNKKSARKSLLLGSVFAALTIVMAILVALTAAGMNPTLDNPDMAFIIVMEKYFPPIICGFLVASLFAAIMSSTDSFLLSCSATIARDIYKNLINPKASEKKIIRIGMIATWVVGFITIFISMGTLPLISLLAGWAAGGLISAFLAPLVIGMYWDGITQSGVFYGMLSGFLVFALLNITNWVPALSELLFAIPISAIITYVVSSQSSQSGSLNKSKQ